jgi:hypothetical protein
LFERSLREENLKLHWWKNPIIFWAHEIWWHTKFPVYFVCILLAIYGIWGKYWFSDGKNENKIIAAQWENISITTSMEVDFWGVKSSSCENSHATEVKRWNISQKRSISYRERSKMNVKSAENPKFSGYHSSFLSRNDFLIKVLSQYRCR